MTLSKAEAGLVVVAVASAIAGFAVWHSKSPASPHATTDDGETRRRERVGAERSGCCRSGPAHAASAAAVAVRRRDEPAPITEAQLMATLREMGGTSPQRSIELAREGQRRFPNSAGAAERDFVVVQSLVNQKRFHEARDEARAMVSKYPDNQFALDAQRHLLVYPLDQPSREEMQQEMQRDR